MTELFASIAPALRALLPLLVLLAVASVVLGSLHAFFRYRVRHRRGGLPFRSQLVMLAITGVFAVGAILALPIAESTRGQLLSLLGLAMTGMIAFSSTAFVSNAMAGLMLRVVGNFRAGDWVRVGEQFGRVTERGLFHTEIQTEDRDLATIPNLYLVTNPVAVVRESGTIVSATVSLGYDRHHAEIEALLAEAARAMQLEDPFVQVVELGDFSVTFRVAGFLADVRHLLTARSKLRMKMLDSLHAAGIEIVSPTFMNQRQVGETPFVPTPRAQVQDRGPAPEEIIFDKANQNEAVQDLARERDRLGEEISALKHSGGDASQVERETGAREARIEAIDAELDAQANDRTKEEPRA